MTRRRTLAVTAGVALAAIAAAVLLWRQRPQPSAPPEPVAAPAPTPSAPVAGASASAPASAVQHVIEAPAAPGPLAASDVAAALTDLLGRKAVLSFLQTENFPHRLVATVDNLGRAHAPPMAWPVNPTAGRFTVEQREGEAVIAADNALRYAPFVLLVETADMTRAVDLYVRVYPLLQQAYEELGYPGRYFNDRLMEVIDQLLATPEAAYPTRLQLTEVKGPIEPQRPWVRYQFADPALESLSAGQKILLRVGAVNERRLKARLAEFRQELLKRTKR